VLKHARGKTVEPMEQVWITNVTMNTAEAHFNEHLTKSTNYGQRLGFGGVTISMCIGLAAQDTAENALMELGMDKIRLKGPLYHGDTLYCYSEVLETSDAPAARRRHRALQALRREPGRQAHLRGRAHGADQARSMGRSDRSRSDRGPRPLMT
jgi:acyl dehydratase